MLKRIALAATAVFALTFAAACGGDDDADPDPTTAGGTTSTATTAASPTPAKPSGSITVYSGRAESLVGPLIEEFEKSTGVDVNVKYGDTAQLAALLLEEGKRSPADVYFAQDGGALGAVAQAGLFEKLPESTLNQVPTIYRSPEGHWVGVSGRARVMVYNPDHVQQNQLPQSVKALTGPEWKDQVGWAPTNGSFQAFITAFRQLEGEQAARQWLEAMKANGVKEYKDNRAVVSAVAAGEIKAGLVNHYYLYGFIKEQGEGFKARNHFFAGGDVGSLVNVAGVGILGESKNKTAARAFVEFLLSKRGQEYFSAQTYEYPLVSGIPADSRLRPIAEIKPPALDLSQLKDLEGTIALLRSTKVLP